MEANYTPTVTLSFIIVNKISPYKGHMPQQTGFPYLPLPGLC